MNLYASKRVCVPSVFLICLGMLFLPGCKKSGEQQAPPSAEPTTEAPAVETAAPPVTEAFADWVEYGSKPDGFTIMTPKSFDLYRDKTQTEAGEIELVTYLAELPTVAYGVVCNDFPQEFIAKTDPNKLLKNGSEGFIAKLNGVLTGERLLSMDGHAGLEITMTGSQQGVGLFGKARIYLIGNHLYQVTAIAEKGKEDLAAIDHFLDSFKVTS
jgi:hypothetical protein